MFDNDFCNLKVKKVFKTYNYRHTYLEECITKDILDDLEEGKNTDKFEIKEDGKLYCNVAGAEYIAYRVGADFKYYKATFAFRNAVNMLTEDKIPLNTNIDLTYDIPDDYKEMGVTEEFLNQCIADTIGGITLFGYQVKDIDPSVLSNKDIKTINGSFDKYRIMTDDGKNHNECICGAYEYVNKNDPEILTRMIYTLDPDYVDIDEQYEKYRKLEYDDITLRFNRNVKELEKQKKEKEARKDKKKNKGKKKNKKKK